MKKSRDAQISSLLFILISWSSITVSQIGIENFGLHARSKHAAIDAEKLSAHILNDEECAILDKYCGHLKSYDDLSVLECVSSLQPNQLKSLPSKCQHTIWQQTRQFATIQYIGEQLLLHSCVINNDVLVSCEGATDVFSCLEKNSGLTDSCQSLLHRIQAIIFIDFEERSEFFVECGLEVARLHCGRLNVEHHSISQLETIACLQELGGSALEQSCMAAINKIQQELEDNAFLEVCKLEIKHFCPEEHHGDILKCLIREKNNARFSTNCSKKILARDNEIARDYRASHSLAKACKDDIKNFHCRRGVSEDKQVRLAQILLCLESVIKNGTQIGAECRSEIDDHRKMLMTDFQLSPEILSDCSDDISKLCHNRDAEMIHCLMDHARIKRKKDRVTAQCQRALEKLVKITDAGEDWRVDPILRRACKPVVDHVCSETVGGDARVISCLMEHIGSPSMVAECEHALLLIQYFVARDFKLDPQLYKNCHEDAIKFCRAKKVWDDVTNIQMDPERGPLILPCLHRIAYSDDEKMTLHKACYKEVKRVMRQRAISVDLIPEVEDLCIADLSVFCNNRIEKGAEMECLQNNLEKLQSSCKAAVSAYTEEEAAHVELNPIIMSVCKDAMKVHCEHIMTGDNGDMMECLISHKNDADLRQDLKCRAAIEHFQIISLKNYHFTYKFKQACRPYVVRFCTVSATKNEVVSCLSEVMRNDTIRGQRHSIPKECRQQVKAQLYQQRESIALDPSLANACKKEIDEFCRDEKGPGQALECLMQNTARLGKSCHHVVFLIKKSELGDSATDYTLVNTCREMTYKFCANTDSVHLLDCLKTYKDDPVFDPRCHLVVVNRMIEQNTDFRFNPFLQLACGKNIDKFCSDIIANARPNEELNGKVVQCLKVKFRESQLEPQCEQEMIKVLQEQALNYKLNPLLQNFCKSEIEVLCKPTEEEEEHGLIEECLKTAFLNQKIINRDCKIEIANLIAETKADIHVDPILEDACTVDLLRYCSNVRSGNGRKLKCLQVILQDQSKAMEEDCRNKLKRRMEMFTNAETVLAQPPENMEQLVNQVITSPAKRFFIVILITAVGMIFIMGIFLGRVTKHALNTKNK